MRAGIHRGESLSSANPVILGLPRGGVPVTDEVAQALGAPLDVVIVRKLGSPMNPEFGFGAVGEGGAPVTDEATRREVGLGTLLFEEPGTLATASPRDSPPPWR
ncbi:MAG: hypothetical protein ACOYO9_03250 [Candidatus Nanopelagicales bacterium]|jgi:putative phosphoribosyl transferase